ncbi:hypothetical protein RhiJN_01574 [Ceratobasidium sp. AG-Ba]|nr:hypothetical protein RhiJN_01574 [Ceratobasidium sp. AG-Ba]
MTAEGKVSSWTDLVNELKIQWPPLDTLAEMLANLDTWNRSKLDDSKLGTVVKTGDREQPYHVWWAKDRQRLAGKLSMDDLSKAQTTYANALSLLFRGMLGKSKSSYTKIHTLCKDIMEVDQDQIEDRLGQQTRHQELASGLADIQHRIGRMDINRQAQPYQSRASSRAAPRTQAQFADSYGAPYQAQRQLASHAPPTPAPAANPLQRTPRQQTLASPFVPRSALPAASPGRGKAYDDTDAGQKAYKAQLANTATVEATAATPYPLTPGTLRQNERVCPRCGKGNHSILNCDGIALPSEERRWRGKVKSELMTQGVAKEEQGMLSTRMDAYAIMVEDGREEDALELLELAAYVDEEEAGKVWGQQ